MRLLRKICLLGCACSGLCLSTILLTSCSEKTNPFANYKVGQEIHVNSMKEAQSLHDVAITKLPVENTIKSISKSTAGANQLIIEIQGSLPAASDENAKEYGGSIIYWELAYHVSSEVLNGSKKEAKGSIITGNDFYVPGYGDGTSAPTPPQTGTSIITYSIDGKTKEIPTGTQVTYGVIDGDNHFHIRFGTSAPFIDNWKTRVLQNVKVVN